MDKYTKQDFNIGGAPIPFGAGGVDTVRRKAQLPPGGYSNIKNMRGWHPGLESRAGYIKGHTTPITNESLGTWANRLEIIIEGTLVPSQLRNFPLLLKISASSGIHSVDLGEVFTEIASDANRKKIAVTLGDGATQLPVEIELWDHANELAYLHVKVPTILAGLDTTLFLYYDSAQPDNTDFVGDTGDAIAQTVWDSSFKAVYHLGQDPSLGGNSILDSTSNLNHGTPGGTMLTGDLVDVVVGKGLEFDGVDDTVDFGSGSSIDGISELTVEAIINPTGWGSNDAGRIVSKTNDDHTVGWELFVDDTTDRLAFVSYRTTTEGAWGKDSVLTLSTDAYVAVTYENESGDNDPILYVDGSDVSAVETSTPVGSAQDDSGQDLRIASNDPSDATDNFFDGKLDEVRISDIVRSADWIETTSLTLTDSLCLYSTGFLTGFDQRIKIVIDHTKVDENLINFPLCLHIRDQSGITDFDATPVIDEITADGNRLKIAVTGKDQITNLYVEIDLWETASDFATLHVGVPFINKDVDTVLYLYYDVGAADNSTYVGDTQSAPAQQVWDSNFIVVCHHQYPADCIGACQLNSVSSSHNGDPVSMESGDSVIGLMSRGLDIDGSEHVAFGKLSAIDDVLIGSFEILTKPNTWGQSNAGRAFSKLAIGFAGGWAIWIHQTSSRFRWSRYFDGTDKENYVNNAITLDTFAYLAVTDDSSTAGNPADMYLDGELQTLSGGGGGAGTAETDGDRIMYTGTSVGTGGDYFGEVDEARLSDIIRPAEYFKATSHSMYDTLVTFVEIQQDEGLPGPFGPIKNIYHWSKDRRDEKRLFVQTDEALLYQTDFTPPTVGTDFGTVMFTGTDPDEIASFANVRDILLYSNFADQHQIFSGDRYPIGSFVFCQDDTVFFPDESQDFSDVLSNLDVNTAIDLSALTGAADEAWFLRFDTMPTSIHWEIAVANANGSAAFTLYGWDGITNLWDTLAYTDNTTLLTVDGNWDITNSVATRLAADEQPRFLFNEWGFWYRIKNTGTGDPTNLEVSKISHDSEFQDIHNLWDGIEIDIVEAQIFDDDLGVYYTYPASTISLSAFHDDDIIYASCQDRAMGLYIDLGATPDLNGFVTLPVISYWNGTAWTAQTIQVDGTNNMTESGWLFWGQTPDDDSRQQFRNTKYYAHWYRLTWTIEDTSVPDTMSDAVTVGMTFMPSYNINSFGTIGNSNCSWKERGCYTFKNFPRDIYVSGKSAPMVLNGSDFAILEPGDGRMNRVVSMKSFYNELMVWQREEGKEGGCTTLFEGFNPTTYGKLILSTQIGSFSDKSTVVVDGSIQTTRRDDLVQTTAFWISHYGIYVTDGRIVTSISDDIQNYFDPRFDECIRQGFEDEMWIAYDSTALVLRVGLVSGASATECNVFLIYDLVTGTWSFDEYFDSISCMSDVEADSGQFWALQYAGASSGVWIYRHNVGVNDNDEPIDAVARLEFSSPYMMNMTEFAFRMKIQSAGSCTMTIYENDQVVETRDVLMTVAAGEDAFPFAETGDSMIRHRELIDNEQTSHISIELSHNEVDERLYLFDYITDLSAIRDR